MARNLLTWWPELGYGKLEPDAPIEYGDDYWRRYTHLDSTACGRNLTMARMDMVRRFSQHGELVDVGIGGGAFVRSMSCLGLDVNANAIRWLESRKALWSQSQDVARMSFWDSLEHIVDPLPLLRQCSSLVFVSMPIYESAEHCVHSKHFKPNEHVWYFTEPGLVRWFSGLGFELRERNHDEERLGREGVASYCFERVLPVR